MRKSIAVFLLASAAVMVSTSAMAQGAHDTWQVFAINDTGVPVNDIELTLGGTGVVGKETKSLEMIFRMADTNSDGKLSSSEFSGMRTGGNEEERKRRFKKLDRNGDGRLTLEEFKRGNKDEQQASANKRLLDELADIHDKLATSSS